MKVNAAEEDFELMELFGKTVLFTNMRVDRSTVPKELYVYELRDEDCTGDICEIRPFVMVNHWGTLLVKEPFDLEKSQFTNNAYLCINPEEDWNYLGENYSF